MSSQGNEEVHGHIFQRYHADFCHYSETGYICECGEKRARKQMRDFSTADSAWWHWGRDGCPECSGLMRDAGLDPRALHDEQIACKEIDRQMGA